MIKMDAQSLYEIKNDFSIGQSGGLLKINEYDIDCYYIHLYINATKKNMERDYMFYLFYLIL